MITAEPILPPCVKYKFEGLRPFTSSSAVITTAVDVLKKRPGGETLLFLSAKVERRMSRDMRV